MSSKVLRGDEAGVAQPLPWRQAARTAPPFPSGSVTQTVPSHTAAAPASPSAFNGTTEELRQATHQIQTLQSRIVELERTAELRAQQARDGAFREGENAGRAQATAEIQSLLEKLAHSIREVTELRPKLRHEAETDLLTLALAIAKKVLHREVTADPEALCALIRVALEKVRMQEVVRVRLHPQHHAPIQQFLARIPGGGGLDLVPDARLTLGSILVETTRGEYDVSIDTQLREIEHGLADRLKSKA